MRTKHNQVWADGVKRLPLTIIVMFLTMLVWLNTWKQWQALNNANHIVATFEKQYWDMSEENGRLKRELASLMEPGSQEILFKRSTGWRGPDDFNIITPKLREKENSDQSNKMEGSKIGEWLRLFGEGGYGKMAR